MKNILLVSFALCLTGCATAYQPIGTDETGGYQNRRLTEDVFSVSFKGNGFTAPKKANDYALLRAADVTLEYRYRYFEILGTGDLSSSSAIQTGSTSYTSGSINSYGGFTGSTQTSYQTIPVFKPGSELAIKCYDKFPTGLHVGKIYDARQIQSELRAKYHLK